MLSFQPQTGQGRKFLSMCQRFLNTQELNTCTLFSSGSLNLHGTCEAPDEQTSVHKTEQFRLS